MPQLNLETLVKYYNYRDEFIQIINLALIKRRRDQI